MELFTKENKYGVKSPLFGGDAMGAQEVICPHCQKQKVKVDFDDKTGAFKKIKGGNWVPTVAEQGAENWVQDPSLGIAVNCKCGKHYFIHSYQQNPVSYEVSNAIPTGQHHAVYCVSCTTSFIDPGMKCPSCGKQY
ncbi:MAG: hypothetical protein ACXACE_11390 [Candidatus Thorarchaeota archaeon]